MNIPFHPNTGDGTHCFQAVLMMALAKLMPDREFSYEDLDLISRKKPGMWTWPTAAMLWMTGEGLEPGLIEEFDYRAFVDRGGDYLIERYGEEVGRAQMAMSDIETECEIAREFVDVAPIEYRIPTVDDIKKKIDDDCVVIVNLNSAALQELEGYSAHFVVICEVDEKNITLHDPGLPARPDLKVSTDVFERAWGYPTLRDRNLLFIRRS